MATPKPNIEPGSVLDGKYVVEGVLGRGGMGVVLAAKHRVLGTEYAIKLLLSQTLDPDMIARFHREARSAVQLTSPHAGRVHDVGSLADGTPYMVMERLRGRDLEGVLRAQGPLPVDLVIRYALQALAGLAEAHALGIIHRDIKPANLFLAEQPDGLALIKVLDFGIARGFDEGEVRLTQTKDVMGSPTYMSPEQMRAARAADARSDIWSFGVTLYELLAGRPPFLAGSLADLMVAVLLDTPPPLASARPDLPPQLAEVIHRCLEKAPAQRFQSAAELSEALMSVARRGGISASAPVLPMRVTDSNWSAAKTVLAPASTRSRGAALALVALAACGLSLLVGAAVIRVREGRGASQLETTGAMSATGSVANATTPSPPEPVATPLEPPASASTNRDALPTASIPSPRPHGRLPGAPPPPPIASSAPVPVPARSSDPGGRF